MPKRLAIVISGAVSLGSYEAGVLYEITHAIGQHNVDKNTTDAEKILIDVLTGASAGGMTATIAAQKLLYEAGALDGSYANAFYRPWVADVTLDGLLTMQNNEDPTQSILSSDFVIGISERYVTQRYQSHLDPPRAKHPAAADRIGLGLALSNLNGVDYGLPLRPSGKFIYTRYQDKLTTWLDAADPNDDTLELWDPLRNAAVSCGAFPFAFRVIDVIRHASEYSDPDLVSTIAPTQDFSYTDAGVFQNEPLGLAKNLVDLIDKHLDVDNRFYLFVSPGAKGSTANSDFNASKANFLETALHLMGAVIGQAQFQDWITAEGVNDQVKLFNARADGLAALLGAGAANFAARGTRLQAAADDLLPPLFPSSSLAVAPGMTAPETKDEARTRLKKQFATTYNNLPGATKDTWIDSILVLETAAQLATRDEMTIYGITADNNELASFELCHFAGFFDSRYRNHDYDVGRRKTQDFLANPGALGPIRYIPEAINPIDAKLNGLTLDRMDPKIRETVRDRLRNRAHEMMKEAGIDPPLIGGAVREAIDLAFIKPQLDKLLKL